MKLFYLPLSPNNYHVAALADHLGLEVEKIQVDPFKGETRTPEYLKMNPNGKTPTFLDGDFALWESNAIMIYLAQKKPGNKLWPEDPRARVDIIRWLSWRNAHWMPATGGLLWEKVVKKLANLGDPDPAEIQKGEENTQRFAAVLNQCLEGKQYLVNDQLTLADFGVASPLFYAEICQFPLEGFNHIKPWYQRIASLEAWKNNQPQLP